MYYGSKVLKNDLVELEAANINNVQLLIKWTLSQEAQGPFKAVPNMSEEELRNLFFRMSGTSIFFD